MKSALIVLYLLTVLSWITFEVSLLLKGRREGGRFLSLFTPALIHGISFIFGRDYFETTIPPLFLHGMTYVILVSLAVDRIEKGAGKVKSQAYVKVPLTALILGCTMLGLEMWIGGFQYQGPDYTLPQKFLLCLALFPSMVHCLVDVFLWKSNHRDSPLIYQLNGRST